MTLKEVYQNILELSQTYNLFSIINRKKEKIYSIIRHKNQFLVLYCQESGYYEYKKKSAEEKITLEKKEIKFTKGENNKDSKNKKILLISTGGTVESISSPEKFSNKVSEEGRLIVQKEITNHFKEHSLDIIIPYSILSSNLSFDNILKLKEVIQKEEKGHDLILITLGTDTLSFVSSVLYFLFSGRTNCPIFLLATQQPIDKRNSELALKLEAVEKFVSNGEAQNTVYYPSISREDKQKVDIVLGKEVEKIHKAHRAGLKGYNEKNIVYSYKNQEGNIINNLEIKKRIGYLKLKEVKIKLLSPSRFYKVQSKELKGNILIKSFGLGNLRKYFEEFDLKDKIIYHCSESPLGIANEEVYKYQKNKSFILLPLPLNSAISFLQVLLSNKKVKKEILELL